MPKEAFNSITATPYVGSRNEQNQRNGTGEEKWNQKYEKFERYEGEYFQDALHGKGTYSWDINKEQIVYDGLFYSNKLEGYGKAYYPDSLVFEGLFKRGSRYGPGVLTYPDGTQDVGMWYDKNLIRLCTTVGPERIPKLARTSDAEIKLRKHKKRVTVCCSQNRDEGLATFQSIEINERLLEESHKLYNTHIRDPESYFFNTNLYNAQYFPSTDCYLEIDLSCEEEIHESVSQALAEDKNLKLISSDNERNCEHPTDVLIQSLRFEIEGTEELLKEVSRDIRKAKRLMKIAKASMTDTQIRKSVLFQTDTKNEEAEVPDYIILAEQLQEILEDEEDCDLQIEQVVDYNTACSNLVVLYNAENLLKIKLKDLQAKTNSEWEFKEGGEEAKGAKKMVLVTDLLAWNNEALSMEMLKHSFIHRDFEKDMSYSVANILRGDRYHFFKAGAYEEECVRFLIECSHGHYKDAMKLFMEHDLNPDLCDAKGNTGVMYAAARDKIRTIKTLINLGANIDAFNDECFTPLSLCVARYLACKEKVIDWEKAFLAPTTICKEEQDAIQEWRPHVSLSSITDILQTKCKTSSVNLEGKFRAAEDKCTHSAKLEVMSDLFGSNLDVMDSAVTGSLNSIQLRLKRMKGTLYDFQEEYNQKTEGVQNFLLTAECVRPISPSKKDKDKKSEKLVVNSLEKIEIKPEDVALTNKLSAIHDTILTLLILGADPNLPEVPLPVLLLATFTRNLSLIEDLLLANANPNITTLEENLTPLHVIVSLPPSEDLVEITKLFFKYMADPHARTSPNHWIEEKEVLLAKRYLTSEDLGKTPLHLLSMRYDFTCDHYGYFDKIAFILIENGASVDDYYLGHTALSLAILRGNVALVKTLLDSQIDPNQILGEEMGTPLALFILKRYTDVLPLSTCLELLQVLFDYKANPFNTTGERGNLIEFLLKEYEPVPDGEPTKGKKAQKNSGGKYKKGVGGKVKQSNVDQYRNVLFFAAKTTLEKHIKGWTVKCLYRFVEAQDYYDDISENMARFLNPAETVQIAQLLICRGRIAVQENTYNTLYDLVEFIVNVANKHNSNTKLSSLNVSRLLESVQLTAIHKNLPKAFLFEPEAERHTEKYNVCFHCFKKQNKQLFVCPKCYLIYFCSQECNELSNKEKNQIHKCDIVFYNESKNIYEERLLRGGHWEQTCLDFQQLTELRMLLGWVPEIEVQQQLLHTPIQQDPRRKLHLTRNPTHEPKHTEGTSEEVLFLYKFAKDNLRLQLHSRMQNYKFKKSMINDVVAKNKEPVEGKEKLIANRNTNLKSRASFSKSPIPTLLQEKERNGSLKLKDLKAEKNVGSVSIRFGTGKIYEFKKRLPNKYQYFLGRICEYWPEFDLSMVCLPYACYTDGQIYYKFLTKKPVFSGAFSFS